MVVGLDMLAKVITELQSLGVRVEQKSLQRTGGAGPSDPRVGGRCPGGAKRPRVGGGYHPSRYKWRDPCRYRRGPGFDPEAGAPL